MLPPAVRPKTLIGELLLCFQLLNDILGYHVAVTQPSALSSTGYYELQKALEKVQLVELKRLGNEFANATLYTKAEAARNLHTRLKELAKVGYLAQRDMREDLLDNRVPGPPERPMPMSPSELAESVARKHLARNGQSVSLGLPAHPAVL